jgi:ABC-type sugar transport system ATPase subunit
MANVSIRQMSKRFASGAAALENVNVEIHTGEFVVLVGPSGCGKSTLLRCVAGLEKPTEGEIHIGGRRVDPLPPAERGIGMVFQDYALYPHMNVAENLAFGLKIQGYSKSEISTRISDAAQMLELEALLSRKPAQLSGGQRQRVAIGRALVKHPQVLLLDEPLSNLDAQLRLQTRLEIASLHRRIKSTTLYVTHDQEEAMTLADRIVVLRAGRVQQVAAPMELYRAPVNRFVASFIGSPSMNFLEGELKTDSSRATFTIGSQSMELPVNYCPAQSGRYLLGFRPEAFAWHEGKLPLELNWIENHGYDLHLIASLGGQRITLRAREQDLPRKLKTGESFAIEVDPNQMHWFETQGEQRRVVARVKSD